ncbi:hypothetical protein D770_23415 [Flammeovirgaceae bacterium 311]|nr:hypothetical protein D770_23415 [Flammeovirgaceae bacterium 311]
MVACFIQWTLPFIEDRLVWQVKQEKGLAAALATGKRKSRQQEGKGRCRQILSDNDLSVQRLFCSWHSRRYK